MDFQVARNLSALARAREEILQAILHVDSLADFLNQPQGLRVYMATAAYVDSTWRQLQIIGLMACQESGCFVP